MYDGFGNCSRFRVGMTLDPGFKKQETSIHMIEHRDGNEIPSKSHKLHRFQESCTSFILLSTIDTLPETNIFAENWCLEDFLRLPVGVKRPIFRGGNVMLVSGRVSTWCFNNFQVASLQHPSSKKMWWQFIPAGWDKKTSQLYRDYFINHYKDPGSLLINQDSMVHVVTLDPKPLDFVCFFGGSQNPIEVSFNALPGRRCHDIIAKAWRFPEHKLLRWDPGVVKMIKKNMVHLHLLNFNIDIHNN